EREPDRIQAVRGQPRQRVYRRIAVRVNLEVQMRSGGVAGATNPTDPLACRHRATGDQHFGQVAVPGFGAVPVPHGDTPAVRIVPARLDDPTTGDRADRGAGRCGEVLPGM